MVASRFVIAKYVPDVARFEPINIAVLIISGDRVAFHLSDEAVGQVKKLDPHADMFGLQSLDQVFIEIVESDDPIDRFEKLHKENSQKLVFTLPSYVDVGDGSDHQVQESLTRLSDRLVKPLKPTRRFGRSRDIGAHVKGAFKGLVKAGKVKEDQRFRGASGVDREIDISYVNGGRRGLIGLRLDYVKSRDVHRSAESQAFALHDVILGSTDCDWKFSVVCQFPVREKDEVRRYAQGVFGLVGAHVYDWTELESTVVREVEDSFRMV